jgi:hypothetical protein
MNRSLKSVVFAGLSLLLFTTACNLSNSQPATMPPSPTVSATQTTAPLPNATSTEFVPPVSPTSEFAPFCEEIVAGDTLPQCQFPVVRESSAFCSQKNPYTLILINEGMTYEVLDNDFRCTDAGKKDGLQMLTCTGPMASNFELNVCDPACVVPTVQAENKKCPADYNYNSLQGCCTQEVQVLNRNCVAFEFKTTSCLVDCSVYTTETVCGKNSYACLWDVENKFCYARK